MKPIESPRSIQDYFTALAVRRPVRAAAEGLPGERAGRQRFLELVHEEAARPETQAPGGLRIRDYLVRPCTRPTADARAATPAAGGAAARQEGTRPGDVAWEKRPPGRAGEGGFAARGAAAAAQGEAPGGGVADSRIERAIRSAADRHGIAPDLLRAVVRAESNFDPRAVSAKGAMGLMQLMPETARELGVTRPFDIQQNVDGGARYLKRLIERYGGDLRLALTAYNAGPAAVERHEGEVPYAETRAYVRRVLREARRG